MKPMQDLSFKLSTYTEEMKRLRGGPIIQSILDHFHNFIAKNHERKMLMYSGHDTTLSALLNSLGMFDPPIGKADLFELSSKNWENELQNLAFLSYIYYLTFFNFSCMFLNPNIFFQFEFQLF